MIKIKKRNGTVEKFSRHKLLQSLHNSMRHANIHNSHLENEITDEVIRSLKRKTVTSEDIRKAMCSALKRNNHHEICDYYSLVWLHAKPTKIRNVIKRNGQREKFSPEKLFKSVQKTFKNSHVRDDRKLELVAREILNALGKKYKNKNITTNEIMDIADYVLVKRKLNSIAKHYVMYRYS